MRNKLRIGTVTLTVMLTACAVTGPQSDVAWKSGAKRAWVAGFYSADTPRSELPNCLASLPPDQLSTKRFVHLHYRHVRKMINEVAELPDGVEVKLNEMVEVFPRDCDKGDLSRITRVLPGSAS